MTEPQTFRIKPFEVQAMRWTPDEPVAAQAMLGWLESLKAGPQLSDDGQSIILLIDGTLVEPGSWVFRMPTGLVATGPDDWFQRSYEPVDTVNLGAHHRRLAPDCRPVLDGEGALDTDRSGGSS